MRDFTNRGDINVGRDLFVIDQSRQHELLIYCDNETLVAEEQFRRSNLARERAKKYKRAALFIAFVACFMLAVAIYHWFTGEIENFKLLSTIAPFVLMIFPVVDIMRPTEVEQRHLNTLREIHMLLRERGVR